MSDNLCHIMLAGLIAVMVFWPRTWTYIRKIIYPPDDKKMMRETIKEMVRGRALKQDDG